MNDQVRKTIVVALSGGMVGLLFYSYLHFSETNLLPGASDNIPEFVWALVTGAVVAISFRLLNRQLDRWIPWAKHFAGRFVAGYLVNVVIAIAVTLAAGMAVIEISGDSFFFKATTPEDEDILWKVAILLITSTFIYKVVYALLYSYQHYAIAQIEGLESERKQLELQFDALKSQISPHYLFNSLNTISSLLFNDLPSAEQFIRRLAQTYQYILATQHKKYVMLKEEVDFVQSYYYLLRIRFQQQLSVEINLPSNVMNTRIPPLTLQMLVENAIKHNTPGNDDKLFIYITARDNTHLRVMNTKTAGTDAANSFRVGLENIRKRYAYFTDQEIEVKDDDRFVVSLPVLPHRDEAVNQKYSA